MSAAPSAPSPVRSISDNVLLDIAEGGVREVLSNAGDNLDAIASLNSA